MIKYLSSGIARVLSRVGPEFEPCLAGPWLGKRELRWSVDPRVVLDPLDPLGSEKQYIQLDLACAIQLVTFLHAVSVLSISTLLLMPAVAGGNVVLAFVVVFFYITKRCE